MLEYFIVVSVSRRVFLRINFIARNGLIHCFTSLLLQVDVWQNIGDVGARGVLPRTRLPILASLGHNIENFGHFGVRGK